MKTDWTGIPGAPLWTDLATSDPAKSRAFYGELFGWTAEAPNLDFGGYFMFTKSGQPIAGGMPKPRSDMPDVWSAYLNVTDAPATVEKATRHDAETVVPAMVIDTIGTMAVVSHQAAGVIGMWQPGEHRGSALVREHGTPGWYELQTRDFTGAMTFLRDVFGWEDRSVADTDDFRYSVLSPDDEQYAGVMDASMLPEAAPSCWSVYFAVDDVDVASKEAERLGGTVLDPATDTPYGRLASLSDVTGAGFKLIGPTESMPANGS